MAYNVDPGVCPGPECIECSSEYNWITKEEFYEYINTHELCECGTAVDILYGTIGISILGDPEHPPPKDEFLQKAKDDYDGWLNQLGYTNRMEIRSVGNYWTLDGGYKCYPADECGEYINYTEDQPSWSGLYETWNLTVCQVGGLTKFCNKEGGWDCPPGYHLTNGYCCPDGYEYNPETEKCEDENGNDPDDCLRCYGLDGNVTACHNTSVWIPISYRDQGVKPNQITNIPIQISYAGSSGLNGSDFIGPTTVMIDTKSNENGFSVNLLRSMPIGATLCIELIWEEINCDMFPNCNKRMCITIEDCDISTQPPGSEHGRGEEPPGGGLPGEGTCYEDYDCCRYMPKDFIAWADGIGVPVLTPPFLRDGFIYND